MQGPVVDDLVIAPVDTTLAIYRKDLFVILSFLLVVFYLVLYNYANQDVLPDNAL
jgi:hypothetical protein